MIIEIHDNRTLDEITKQFSEYYPFLKIVFYDEPHYWQEASTFKHQLAPDKSIGEVRKKTASTLMELHPWNKTGSIEQEFRKQFGLYAQIFRKEGNIWLQTIGTDELTLEEQNEKGRLSVQHLLDSIDTNSLNNHP